MLEWRIRPPQVLFCLKTEVYRVKNSSFQVSSQKTDKIFISSMLLNPYENLFFR